MKSAVFAWPVMAVSLVFSLMGCGKTQVASSNQGLQKQYHDSVSMSSGEFLQKATDAETAAQKQAAASPSPSASPKQEISKSVPAPIASEETQRETNQTSDNTGDFKDVKAGYKYTCGLKKSGAMVCWGANEYGQTGAGQAAGSQIALASAYEVFSSGVTKIAIGTYHTCAIQMGALKCWGANGDGQTADPAHSVSNTPYTVFNSGVTDAAIGIASSCALVNGAVWCWGYNQKGELGSTVPGNGKRIVIPNGVVKLAGVHSQTCAVFANGELDCWGENYSGQVNLSTAANQWSPQKMFDSHVTDVSVGYAYTCATLNENNQNILKCWGGNWNGQLGNGGVGYSFVPPSAVFAESVTQFSAGAAHACAQIDGAAYCWGSNGFNRVSPSGVDEKLPVRAFTSSKVDVISAGVFHTCVVIAGRISCIGSVGP